MFEALIAKYCLVPMSVVLSVIHVESSGNPQALSQGNYGLMQVRFATAKEMSCGVKKPEDLFIPEINIKCGCNYLAKQMNRYKDRTASIVAYNQGSVMIDGKPVLNHKELTSASMKGVRSNVYALKILTHRAKICKTYSDCGLK